ncbi:hypothetical protein [Dyadobacter psychrophilus]|uniref:Uncharacterized protein n=1 Tax=Dyadobacter psychrophilus TaxID=651661 RepID=A0A1T5DJS4_9BACT|nr:hypothetical protein [Dyadobacter psychrophilus]SKB71962.1 hypothetical protein SAMN05660293_01671 [Dyadobacter psychrophilus]
MKKLLPLVFLLILASCNDDKDQPVPYPDPAVLAKQQAPFGAPAVDVKLKKLLYNGKLFAEYIYEGDLLSEQKKYLLFSVPGHYQTGSFKRNGAQLESYDVVAAQWIAESQFVSDVFKPSYSIRFDAPANDTLRTVTEENLIFLENFYRTYILDKQGFIKRQEFTERNNAGNDFTITYTRNEQHNVVTSAVVYASQPTAANRVEYEYDNHPNPFFKLGIDRNGQLATHSLSPNNIVKETIIDATGPVYSIEYKYEYGANGYPSKVKVESKSQGFTAYTMDFLY